jgi:uncharacterized membrane protein
MATRDDPSPSVTELLILMANLASLAAVAYVLVRASSAHGARQAVLAALAVLSVAASWALVHALYMLRYAVLYYSGTVGGIDFNQDELPRFMDFGYMAFTIGMTYQVSDTTLRSSQIRLAAFRHGLQAFVFGSVIWRPWSTSWPDWLARVVPAQIIAILDLSSLDSDKSKITMANASNGGAP